MDSSSPRNGAHVGFPSVLRWLMVVLLVVQVGAEGASAAVGSTHGWSSAGAARSAWQWPLRPEPQVARRFEAPPAPWLAGHRGADLVSAPGQAVLAPAGGVVVFAGTVVDRGVVTIEHPGGLRTSYEPVIATVPRGAVVAAGQPVARVSSDRNHCAPTTCLHWGLRRGEVYLDPLVLVAPPRPPVLLPWGGRSVASI